MKEGIHLKLSVYVLGAIIPLSLLGYYFAVNNESLFYIYEWLLLTLIIISILYSIRNIISIRNEQKWVAISTLAFLLQFSVFALFLGPLTHYLMFYLYYSFVIFSSGIYIVTIRKNNNYRIIPVIFMIITALFTIYLLFLHALWGNNLS
ncbi:hypothetical protein N783_01115 [Pontibacillus marinus BH030004 = DSM 16465]|uniref:Uncharacterized protein n=1 Tax=Pontibacillus marinus BH030004 = DSM 16465 TaxID=1385511 RepID=A0A0A5GDR0_9BACI|nr:hypothetical protein N783_01115 [Pontibacillus marinus BH030004 = DSM 16465]